MAYDPDENRRRADRKRLTELGMIGGEPQAGSVAPDSLGRQWVPTAGSERLMVVYNPAWAAYGSPMSIAVFDGDEQANVTFSKDGLGHLIAALQRVHELMPEDRARAAMEAMGEIILGPQLERSRRPATTTTSEEDSDG